MDNESLGGIYVYFPNFDLEVNTSKDCMLSYSPVGKKSQLYELDYSQQRQSLSIVSSVKETAPTPPSPLKRLGSD